MSLTVLVDKKRSEVGIVEWFRGSKFWTLQYPCPPLRQLKYDEFRLDGYQIIHEHFRQFETRRLPDVDSNSPLPEVFEKGQEKIYFKGKIVVFVSRRKPDELGFLLQGARSCSLIGFRNVDPESRRVIGFDAPVEIFWKTFDEVIEEAK